MTGPLLGQEELLGSLLAAAAGGRLHHCYLFEGPPRVGKHSGALLLAMAGVCGQPGAGGRPCGRCVGCRQVEAGTHPDVLIVGPDPGRKTPTISVAQARELIGRLAMRRFSARRRTVIVDPAEAMNQPAANALLKSMEEPPGGTGFVLVSSRSSSILATVLSRCQRVRFRTVPEPELRAWLEGRGVRRAERVARLADGCPGRALLLAGGGLDEIDAARRELLQALAGGPPEWFDYAKALCGGVERQVWMERIERDMEIIEGLARDAVVYSVSTAAPLRNSDLEEVVAAWAGALWPGGVARIQRSLQELRAAMDANAAGKLLVEAMLARVGTELGAARKAA